MFLRFATAPPPAPPQARDGISPAGWSLRSLPDHGHLRIRASAPEPSETTEAQSTATLPTTTILSLGLGFIGAALVAIVLTLFLRYYLVTRVYPERAGMPPPPRTEGGFWARVGGWWDTFLAGYGSAYWEPRYVVRRRPRRPEMWEVMLDEKAAGRGRDSRCSGATSSTSGTEGESKEKEKEKARGSMDAGGPSDARGPGVRLVRVSEEEEELGELTQVSYPASTQLTPASRAQSHRPGTETRRHTEHQ